jgi:hypothetical protein
MKVIWRTIGCKISEGIAFINMPLSNLRNNLPEKQRIFEMHG